MKKPKVPDLPIAPAHFCPAMGCRRWFHTSCLVSGSYILKLKFMEDMTFEDALAGNVPDDEDIDIKPYTIQDQGEQIPEGTKEKAEAFLPSIYFLARRPIVRDKDHIFGNMRAVCLARKLLKHLGPNPRKQLAPSIGTLWTSSKLNLLPLLHFRLVSIVLFAGLPMLSRCPLSTRFPSPSLSRFL